MKSNRNIKRFSFAIAMLFCLVFTSCGKGGQISAPEVNATPSVMMMEQVFVTCSNLGSNVEAVVDYGDGTTPATVKGPFKLTHRYAKDSSRQPGGVYTILVKTGDYVVSKEVKVYPLLALSALTYNMSQSGYDKVLLMAHRSNTTDKKIPENSIAALEACIAAGVDFVETDTQITSDGYVVISHDQTIDRCTNGKGDITKMTLAQVKSYKLKDRNGSLTNHTIPTLEEFMEAARGRIYVNLDYSPRSASTLDVMRVIRQTGTMEQTLFYIEGGDKGAAKLKECLDLDAKAHVYVYRGHYTLLPGPRYFIQAGYYPDENPADFSAPLKAGCLLTLNMLNGGTVEDLLKKYPDVRVIQSDISNTLDKTLKSMGRR